MKEIYLAGGYFWGLEKYLGGIGGVTDTLVGYANGSTESPRYEEVCTGTTGHAETVRVQYDEVALPLPALLDLFFQAIDPTAVNRQGPDRGTQYRTGIYFTAPEDAPLIEQALDKQQKRHRRPLVVEAQPLQNFWPAEAYHQRYLDKNPGGYCHIGKAAFERAARRGGYRRKSAEELKAQLTPLQFQVTQSGATEPAFRNAYHAEHRRGIYVDVTTGEPLFTSAEKFDAGCGWPSFSRPIGSSLLEERPDRSFGLQRTEVRSRTGGAHLGHVFEDGPAETGGRRYCINSAALRFIPLEEMEAEGYGAYLPPEEL